MANRHIKPEAARRRIVSVRYAPAELSKVTAAAKKKKLVVSEYIRERSLEDEAGVSRGRGETQ